MDSFDESTLNAPLLQELWREFNRYKESLENKRLSAHTRRAYVSRLNHFLVFLGTADADYDRVLKHPFTRDRAVADYRDYLRDELECSAATINTTLSTIDHFYQFLGVDEPRVIREDLPKGAPNALTGTEQQELMLAIEGTRSTRDRALALLFLRTGLRLGECAALDVQDFELSSPEGSVNIRSSRKNRARLLALDAETTASVRAWLTRRAAVFPRTTETAAFLSRLGRRITTAGIDLVIRKFGQELGMNLSAEVLRQTCMMNLLVAGKDLDAVARISGHKRRDTTRRYQPAVIAICEEAPAAPGELAIIDLQSEE